MKLNLIDMDWTDTGARVSTNMDGITCPRCAAPVAPTTEHLCGDKLPRWVAVPQMQGAGSGADGGGMKRSPQSNPQPGDVLAWKEWTVRVTWTGVGMVGYRTKRTREEESAERSQTLEDWAKWTPQAKVLERGGELECVVTDRAVGPCAKCRAWVGPGAHLVGTDLYCAEHCPSRHKAKKARVS